MNILTSIPTRVMLGLMAACAAASSLQALTAVSGPDYTLTIDGNQVWGWGNNAQSQLGIASPATVFLPVLLDTDVSAWRGVAIGKEHRLLIDGNGAMYGWGTNTTGQLGSGNTANQATPVLVATVGKSWTQVAAGDKHTVALASDGSVWVWGSDSSGQLGEANPLPPQPTEIFYNIPQQYPGLTAKAVAAAKETTFVVTSAGELYAWGQNSGPGAAYLLAKPVTTSLSRTKVRIGSASNWVKVYAQNSQVFALNSNNELYSWGMITQGYTLGKDATSISSPSKVASGIRDIAICDSHVLAIGTDGTLRGWGYNSKGQLRKPALVNGIPSTNEMFKTPITLDSRTDWVEVTVGNGYSIAFRNGDEAYAAGINPVGQLGTNRNVALTGGGLIGVDETNGFAPGAYKVGDPAVGSVSFVTPQSSVKVTEPMEVDVRIVNLGARTITPQSGQIKVQVYLSPDQTLDIASDLAFGAPVDILDILSPNAETVKRIRAVPNGVTNGSYYAIGRLIIDPSLIDGNAANNLNVSSDDDAGKRSFLPDLIPSITSTLPTAPLQVGDKFTLTGVVLNKGNLSANAPLTVRPLRRTLGVAGADPVQLGMATFSIPSGLAAGASVNVSIEVTIDSNVTVDAKYEVGMDVMPAPDFELSEISTDNNLTFISGSVLDVVAGGGSVEPLKALDLRDGATSTYGLSGFGASEASQVLASYKSSTADTWSGIEQRIDPDVMNGANPYAFVLEHGARPPSNLGVNQTSGFSLEVAGPATIEFTWALLSENDQLSFTVDGAPPQDSIQASTINGNAGLLRYRYLLESNQAKRVLRWNYIKGSGPTTSVFIDSLLIRRETLPDLKITDLKSSKYESNGVTPETNKNFIIGRSQALEITAYGFNAGRALSLGSNNGAQQFSAEVRLSTDRVWGNGDDYVLGVLQQINGLDEGQRFLYGQTFIMNHCLPEGEYYLAVKIDNDGSFNEYDESNNVRFTNARDIVIESRPNLTVEIARRSDMPRPGVYYRLSEVPLEFLVTNNGCKDIPPGAVSEFTFGFYGSVISRNYVEQTNEQVDTESLPLAITQRNYATISDNRGIRAGETRLIRASLQVPRYNEAPIMQFLYGDSGRDWTNYIPLPVEVINPMAVADTTAPVGLFDVDRSQNETSADQPEQFRFFYQRDPILLNLYSSRSASIPLVWDVENVWTYWPRSRAMYVGAVPSLQSYEEFREFWTFEVRSSVTNPEPFVLNGNKALGLTEATFGGLDNDPDGDGLSNRVEWAFGLDPTRPSLNTNGVFLNVGAMSLSTQSNPEAKPGDEFLAVTFNALSTWSNATFTYVVEASDTPGFETPEVLAVYSPGMSADTLRKTQKSYPVGVNSTSSYRPVVEVIENGYLYRITVADHVATNAGSRFMRVRLE